MRNNQTHKSPTSSTFGPTMRWKQTQHRSRRAKSHTPEAGQESIAVTRVHSGGEGHVHFVTVETPDCKPAFTVSTRSTPLTAHPAVCSAANRRGTTRAPRTTEASCQEAVSAQLRPEVEAVLPEPGPAEAWWPSLFRVTESSPEFTEPGRRALISETLQCGKTWPVMVWEDDVDGRDLRTWSNVYLGSDGILHDSPSGPEAER